jgi:gamma-butyrobetaine dioxygenase
LANQALFGLPAIWLRDNCQCARCRDPATGEPLVSITDLPRDVSVVTSTRTGNRIKVVFGPDGHQSTFDAGWLGQYAAADQATGDGSQFLPRSAAWQLPPGADGRNEDAKRLWSAADLESAFPAGSWPLFLADATHREACLAAVLRDGFVVLRDVPTEPGTVLTVARGFGLIRETTEYGPMVELQVTARPRNRVYTTQAVAPRSGLVFRDPVPAVEVAHCLRPPADGGDTVVIDGFRAAAMLHAEHPRAFEVLARTEVTFAYSDAASDLRATKPVIGLGPSGRIREIRFDRSLMQPVRMPPNEVVDFYDAYRAFAEVIGRPSLKVTFRLRQGDCVVADNTRILMGRTSFTGAERHMQLCWADLDTVASKLAVMRRPRRNGRAPS